MTRYIGLVFIGLMLMQPVYGMLAHRDITSVGTSAGMIGLGHIQGFSKNSSVIFENPASLRSAGNTATLFYTSFFGDVSRYMSTSLTYKVSPYASVGVGLISEDIGNNDLTSVDSNNEIYVSGTFQVRASQIYLSSSYALDSQTDLGVSLIQYDASMYTLKGTGMDFMVGFSRRVDTWVVQGFAKNILGGVMSYQDGSKEKLPMSYGLSAKSDALDTLWLTPEFFAQVNMASDLTGHSGMLTKNLGARLYPLAFLKDFTMSVGYRDVHNGQSVKGAFSLGLSMQLTRVSLDYAYNATDVVEQESQHYFSVSYRY